MSILSRIKASLTGLFLFGKRKADMESPTPERPRPIEPEVTDNVLFVNAHPDDEAMAHGGAISSLTERNAASVFVLTATLGAESTKGDNSDRKGEAEKSYDTLGVEETHRFYETLPDTELHKPATILALAGVLVEYIEEHDIHTLVTPGWEGFDGHSDHQAVHVAAILAAHEVRQKNGREVGVLALQSTEEGEIYARVDYDQKYAALSHHGSQFMDDLDNIIEANDAYKNLMKEETYSWNNSPEDYERAQRLLSTPLTQHIPK